ncbi:hypothetical protein [Microbacterium sp. 13-71-7]|jgi:hypothetical protein|uniref:hypothetical protein n=1 Tax=Microbacterium sp. 13-71-7 TaxID=1970399 RepID=UPI000BD678CF|nr:hypothetical protein [Microbacterium sp. 13-71-7]OZB83286.1 MAG: hypothetical protein B7X32_10905 [Microbacterium sp. 13-71-7]
MSVTLILPLPAPLGVGRIVAVDEESRAVRIRDLTSGVVYRVPGSVLPELGALPWRGRVEACSVLATEEGVVTELVLDAVPGGAVDLRGSAIALEGAEEAAAAAKAQAAIWGGTDRPPQEEQPRFW